MGFAMCTCFPWIQLYRDVCLAIFAAKYIVRGEQRPILKFAKRYSFREIERRKNNDRPCYYPVTVLEKWDVYRVVYSFSWEHAFRIFLSIKCIL